MNRFIKDQDSAVCHLRKLLLNIVDQLDKDPGQRVDYGVLEDLDVAFEELDNVHEMKEFGEEEDVYDLMEADDADDIIDYGVDADAETVDVDQLSDDELEDFMEDFFIANPEWSSDLEFEDQVSAALDEQDAQDEMTSEMTNDINDEVRSRWEELQSPVDYSEGFQEFEVADAPRFEQLPSDLAAEPVDFDAMEDECDIDYSKNENLICSQHDYEDACQLDHDELNTFNDY